MFFLTSIKMEYKTIENKCFNFSLNYLFMSKKSIIIVLLLFIVVAINVVHVFAKSSVSNFFYLTNVEALANGEDGPGNYKGARNSYCKKPKGTQGCVSDINPSKTCTYSIYCIE